MLDRPPRPPDQPIFDRRMIVQTGLSGVYMGFAGFAFFLWALNSGMPEDQARTVLLLLMVLFENVHVFNCRSEARSVFRIPLAANPWIGISVAVALAIHVGALHWAPSAAMLRMSSVTPEFALSVVPIALGLLLVFEFYKWLQSRR